MDLFNRKYRIDSARLPGWDYSQAGCYFVTICTKNHFPFFGEVVDGTVKLSRIGEIVADEWVKTDGIRPNVVLDEWVIMPNHIHAIVAITHKIENPVVVGTPRRGVSTTTGRLTGKAPEKWGPNTLGSIIGQFQGKCTKRIWAEGYTDFIWQARFYDHIVRTDKILSRVRKYIVSNPMN